MPAASTAGMPATRNGAMSRATSSSPSPAGAAGSVSLTEFVGAVQQADAPRQAVLAEEKRQKARDQAAEF